MADGATTYGVISQRTAAWAATVRLRHAEPVLILQKFGTPKEMPRNKADTVKFRRPIPFSAADTPLTEGVTPTAPPGGGARVARAGASRILTSISV